MRNVLLFLLSSLVMLLHAYSDLDIQKEDKAILIEKAEDNNINAMLALHIYYDFPNTIEGLKYYKKWYTTIDDLADEDGFYEVAKIYQENHERFINGFEKVNHLNELLIDKGETQGLDSWIIFIHSWDSYSSADAIYNKYKDKLSDAQLDSLCEFYYKRNDANRLPELKKEYLKRGLKPSHFIFVDEYRKFYDDQAKKDTFISKLLMINDSNLLAKFAREIYNDNKEYKLGLELMEKAYTMDNSNQNALLRLANMYYNIEQTDKALALYEKNVELNSDIDSATKLLYIYSSDKTKYKEYENIKKLLKETQEGKYVLADYFYEIGLFAKANYILEPLAEAGEYKAQLKLVVKNYKDGFSLNPQRASILQHWQDKLSNSQNKQLTKQFYKDLSDSRCCYAFLKKKREEALKNFKLDQLSSVASSYSRNRKNEIYDEKIIESGDVGSILALASNLIRTKKDENIKKGLALYKDLAEKGDFKAMRRLSSYYGPDENKELVDIPQQLYYYELAEKSGDTDSLIILANLYLCVECNMPDSYFYKQAEPYKEYIDYEKALYYNEKALEKGISSANFNLAYMYDEGKGVDQDYEKAIKYYKNSRPKSYVAYRIGYFYEMGLGVKKDIKKAYEMYNTSMQYKPNKEAALRLALMYENGNEAVKQDLNEALYIFEGSKMEADVKRVKEKIDKEKK